MNIKEKIDSLNELIKDGNEFVASISKPPIASVPAFVAALNEAEIAIAAAKKELAKLEEIHGGADGTRAALEYDRLREKASDAEWDAHWARVDAERVGG